MPRRHACGSRLNGKLLYEATDAALGRGRIGFYANQGLAHVKDIVVDGPAAGAGGRVRHPAAQLRAGLRGCRRGRLRGVPGCLPAERRSADVRVLRRLRTRRDAERTTAQGRPHLLLHVCRRRPNLVAGRGPVRRPRRRSRSVDRPAAQRPADLQLFLVAKEPGSVATVGRIGLVDGQLRTIWAKPGRLPRQISKDYYCSTPIRELSSGRLILGLYAERDGTAHGAVVYSDDGGRTWGREVDIDNGGIRLDAETDVIELKDGTLYAAQRPHMSYATSSDRGQTWTVSKPMGFPGHCPYFLRTKDDIILLAHRVPNTSLHYSLDECRTWSDNVPVDDVGGAYPSMVNLQDGSVLIVYYEEGAGSSIRAKRLRTTPAGIQWLR